VGASCGAHRRGSRGRADRRPLPAVGPSARPPGAARRVGQPHLPVGERPRDPSPERGGVRRRDREGAALAAVPGALAAPADPRSRRRRRPRRRVPVAVVGEPLRVADVRDGPSAGPHSFFRGGDLAVYGTEAREAIEGLADRALAAWATGVLDRALSSSWTRPGVWAHGDVAVGNLLVRNGAHHPRRPGDAENPRAPPGGAALILCRRPQRSDCEGRRAKRRLGSRAGRRATTSASSTSTGTSGRSSGGTGPPSRRRAPSASPAVPRVPGPGRAPEGEVGMTRRRRGCGPAPRGATVLGRRSMKGA
jgi:hypothetical protein